MEPTPVSLTPTREFDPKKAFLEGAGAIFGGACVALTGGAYGLYNLLWKASGDEALRDPLFWTVIGAAWAVAAALAFCFRRRAPYRIIDLAIAGGLAVIAATCFGTRWVESHAAVPSESVYAVAVFDSDTESGKRFVAQLLPKLQTLDKSGRFVTRHIQRVPLGETQAERAGNMRQWAKRRGAHLAVGEALEGSAQKVRLLEVASMGKDVNDIGFGHQVDNPEEGTGAVESVAIQVKYEWGLAEYRRGKYDRAVELLDPIPLGPAQFYCGLSSFQKYHLPKGGASDLDTADTGFRQALRAESQPSQTAAEALLYMGITGQTRLRDYIAKDETATFRSAVNELQKAREMFQNLNMPDRVAAAEVEMADVYSARPVWLTEHIRDIDALLHDAIPKSDTDRAVQAGATFEFALAQTYLARHQDGIRLCDEVVDLHASIRTKLAGADATLLDAAALGTCADVRGDAGMFDESEREMRSGLKSLESVWKAVDLGKAHDELGTLLMNHSEHVAQDNSRFDMLERAANEFSQAFDLFQRSANVLQCKALDARGKSRFLELTQAEGETRLQALRNAVKDADAIRALPVCHGYSLEFDWEKSTRAELSLVESRIAAGHPF